MKQACIHFGKLMLNIFESVAVDPHSHHGVQLTMVGPQSVFAKDRRIGV